MPDSTSNVQIADCYHEEINFLFREKKAFFPCDFFDIPIHRHLYGFLLSQKTDHKNDGDHKNDDHKNDGG